jgi:arsenite-transporting ATPase
MRTRFLFFTGKGGVGKTSLACATAVRLADAGKRVLLVSTDPASNLSEVLASAITDHPTPVPSVPGLTALDINPGEAAKAYREKIIGPMRGLLPEAALRSMEEQLSGACTTEIAAFNEFARLLGDPQATETFDHVVFDTAPTGHTLRLLALPRAWTGFFATNTSGTSCLGPLAGLDQERMIYQASLDAISDASRTTLILVSRPDDAALREAARSHAELAALGVTNQHLMLNGVFTAADASDPVAAAMALRGCNALERANPFLQSLPVTKFPLRAAPILGPDALRAVFDDMPSATAPSHHASNHPDLRGFEPIQTLLDDLARPGRGVILTMGKGGVGKTTLAAAIAVDLAKRGYPVHLSTTDPAAHISDALAGDAPGLTISRIDPAVETESYVREVLDSQGKELDTESLSLMEEDLRSPCTEEIAVFRAFARTVDGATDGFVVLDTAPTGHTLLLLDATEAYHRELGRQTRDAALPDAVEQLLPRLRDPEFTRVLLITLPEPTPVHEAAALQEDLRRAGIEPHAWIVNQSLSPLPITDPLLRGRAAAESVCLREVSTHLAKRATLLPWTPEEPRGIASLAAFFTNRSSD